MVKLLLLLLLLLLFDIPVTLYLMTKCCFEEVE